MPFFEKPADCFKWFVTDELLQYLANNSNAKAREFFGPDLKGKVNGLLWKDIGPMQLNTFFALNFIMGINKLPHIKWYWSRHPCFGGPAIFCAKVMSRNKWMNIMKCLRFTHPEEVVPNKPQTRVEPFLDKLREKCRAAIYPGINISIDEALILFKGRLHFRQFIRTKRNRFGIKVFVMCPGDGKWQGYSYDFEVYYGEGTNFFTADSPGNLSKSEEIVVRLLMDLLGQGRHVITDNWYTSLRLAHFLLEHETDITGTINPLRGVPPALREVPLRKKGSAFMRSGDILLCKYEDRKTMYSLTTRYQAEIVEKTKKYFSGQTFFKLPYQLDRYNDFMGSVDKADQVLQPYSWKRKSLAWFKKLCLHFIDRMLFNSFIVYDIQNPEYKQHYVSYIRDVCTELLRRNCPAARELVDEFEAQNRRPAVRARQGPPQRSRLPRRRVPVHVSSSSSPPSGDDQPTPGRWAELDRRRRQEERRQEAIAAQEARVAQVAREQQAARATGSKRTGSKRTDSQGSSTCN